MKIAAVSGAIVAAVAAGSIATPSFAREYDSCRDAQHNRGTTGAVVGGLAGAVIGSNVAGRGDRTAGTLIGGDAGALLGNAVGRSSAGCHRYSSYDRPYRASYRGYPTRTRYDYAPASYGGYDRYNGYSGYDRYNGYGGYDGGYGYGY